MRGYCFFLVYNYNRIAGLELSVGLVQVVQLHVFVQGVKIVIYGKDPADAPVQKAQFQDVGFDEGPQGTQDDVQEKVAAFVLFFVFFRGQRRVVVQTMSRKKLQRLFSFLYFFAASVV